LDCASSLETELLIISATDSSFSKMLSSAVSSCFCLSALACALASLGFVSLGANGFKYLFIID
jgi:hypothetical protein